MGEVDHSSHDPETRPAGARPYLGWLVVLLIAAAVAAAALQPAGAQEEEMSNPVAFAEASYAAVCAECHGDRGSGGTVPGTDLRAPALAGNGDVTTPYVDLVLRTGRMPPPGDPFDNRARDVFYTDAERQAMVAWMTDQFELEGEIPEVGAGDIAVGLETFALHCAHCHGNAGAGGTAGATAFTPRVSDQGPVAVVEAIRIGPFEMPAFTTEVISEEEANSIAAYLQAVDEEAGTPVLGLVELNPVFASGFVGLLALITLGSLLYIGGRPVPFEKVHSSPLHALTPPRGMTPMPGDPGYQQADYGRDQDHEPIPYTDEDDGGPTSGSPQRHAAGESSPAPTDSDADEGDTEVGDPAPLDTRSDEVDPPDDRALDDDAPHQQESPPS
jgi:ubiquinol-cytochrome c reductase cytochrome c subunit